jgi:two-component system phosphate regulon sensor histidine kinase PhoR
MSTARVLVVDDEYGVRSGIRQILELEGYEVEEASTGEEALALLRSRSFDVGLLDYRLPDMDGLTIQRAIKSEGLQLMTCMITAYANIDTAIAATREGVDFFLPKPFLPDDLLGVLDTLLRHKLARDEAERLRRENEASLLALAEEKTQTHSLVSSLRDAVMVVNREGEVVLANRAMTALLGIPEEEALHRTAADLLGEGPLAALAGPLAAPQKDRTVDQLVIGEDAYMSSVVTFRAEDGTALGRILTLSDISQVRRLALEKERFIRTMVHEMKSPLGAVRAMVEVATDRSLGPQLESYVPMLRRAEDRIDNLVRLIGDLLALSKSEQPQAEPWLQDAAAAVESVLAQEAAGMAARDVSAATEIEPGLPPVLLPDGDLELILSNLVGNAVKYNREGGKVTVRLRRESAWVSIEVADTGVGIAADNLERVFAEFFREKRPQTRDREGSGLGLTIAKRLTERAGGSLTVASIEGEGSVFTVMLPA